MDDSNNIVSLPTSKKIEAEASAWIVRLKSDNVTAQERLDMLTWQQQSPQHQQALEHMAALWGDLDLLSQSTRLREQHAVEPNNSIQTLPRSGAHKQARYWPIAAAALLLVTLSLGVFKQFYPAEINAEPQLYKTQVGIQKTVALPDGSSMQLNTNTQVEVRYTATSRDIRLLQGEAFFDVASNKERPFRVYAGTGLVRAVGTAFSVFLREQNVEVAVTEGSVEVSSLLPPAETPTTVETPKPTPLATVTAGKLIHFSEQIESVTEVNHALSWRQGILEFSGDPLTEVIADVSRYTDINIIINDSELSDLRIGGYFRVGEVDALLQALEHSFGVRVERDKDNAIHLSATL